jgi:hypothetical protein
MSGEHLAVYFPQVIENARVENLEDNGPTRDL